MRTMEQEQGSGKRRSNVVWLLVILAVVLVWLWWRPPQDSHKQSAVNDPSETSDLIADEIIVDFKDADSDTRVAEVGKQLGLTFELVSNQAIHERLYKAHVDPALRDE